MAENSMLNKCRELEGHSVERMYIFSTATRSE